MNGIPTLPLPLRHCSSCCPPRGFEFVRPGPEPCEKQDDKHDTGQNQHPHAGRYPIDQRRERYGAESASGNAAEAHDAVQPLCLVSGNAVVQKRKKGRNHQGAEEIAEQVKRPDGFPAGIGEKKKIGEEADY